MTWLRCSRTVTALIPMSAAICLYATGHQESHDLLLASGQRFVTRPEFRNSVLLLGHRPPAQLAGAQRLLGALALGNIAETTEKPRLPGPIPHYRQLDGEFTAIPADRGNLDPAIEERTASGGEELPPICRPQRIVCEKVYHARGGMTIR
jgi:hypothetical protein